MKDIKVFPNEECITQRKPLACDFKVKKVKDTNKEVAPKRKMWKLHILNVGMNPHQKVCHVLFYATSESEEQDFTSKLKTFRVKNINRIIIAHMNINSIRNKVDLPAEGVREVLIFSWFQRLRLMTLFVQVNLLQIGDAAPCRFRRSDKGGGVLVFIREDIPSNLLKTPYL